MIRWYLDLAIFQDTRIVGRLYQLPAEGEKPAPGQVGRPAKWEARGMLATWDDTGLGRDFKTRAEAQRAIVDWWASIQGKTRQATA